MEGTVLEAPTVGAEGTNDHEVTEKVQPEKIPQPNPKKARAEGNRVAMKIKAAKAQFYIDDVDLDDQIPDVVMASEAVRKTLGKVSAGFMVISAGVTHLLVIVDVPKDKVDQISAKTWLLEGLTGISTSFTDDSTDTCAKAFINITMPFPLKNTVRSNAFAYLRKCKLLEEEESDEEVYTFDD